MKSKTTKQPIPALSEELHDFGNGHMVGRHRYLIAEKFGLRKKDFPKGVANQNQLMKMLKAEDPKKYNTWYDAIVRGVEPQAEKEIVVNLPKELRKEAEDVIDNGCKAIMNLASAEERRMTGFLDARIEDLVGFLENKIAEEAKVLNKTIVEHHIKSSGKKTKKVKDILPEEFQTILDLASQRINILLVGPSGCGKSHISKVVADSMDLEFAAQSCSAGMSESAFAGWLLPIGAGGKFEYVSSEFVRLYENGGVFLLDEIDAADANTMLFLNGALANGEFYLPQRHKNPRVVKSDNFICIAAANTFGNGATAMYSGRNLMDGATMDRFRTGIVPMDYSPHVERELVDPLVLEWGKIVRGIIERKGIRKVMSTRVLRDSSKMKSIGWKIGKIEESYFADWSKEERRMAQSDTDYQNFKRNSGDEFTGGDQ